MVHISDATSGIDRRRLWYDLDFSIRGWWRGHRVLGVQTLPLIAMVTDSFICNWPCVCTLYDREDGMKKDFKLLMKLAVDEIAALANCPYKSAKREFLQIYKDA